MLKETNTPTRPRIEPGSPDPESDALTIRPVRLCQTWFENAKDMFSNDAALLKSTFAGRYDDRSRRGDYEGRRDEFYVPERRDWPNRREEERRYVNTCTYLHILWFSACVRPGWKRGR